MTVSRWSLLLLPPAVYVILLLHSLATYPGGSVGRWQVHLEVGLDTAAAILAMATLVGVAKALAAAGRPSFRPGWACTVSCAAFALAFAITEYQERAGQWDSAGLWLSLLTSLTLSIVFVVPVGMGLLARRGYLLSKRK